MRILMVSGPVHYVHCLCRALGEAGETVRLLAPSVYDVVDGYPTPYEVRRPFREGGYLGGLRAILSEAREFRPDVVHFQWTFSPRRDWFMARWLPRLGAPALLTVHNVLPHEPALVDHRLAIYGDSGWRELASRFPAVQPFLRLQVLSAGEANLVYNAAGVVLNIHHPQSRHGSTCKTYEAACAGAAVLADHNPVLAEHTYAHRMTQMVRALGLP